MPYRLALKQMGAIALGFVAILAMGGWTSASAAPSIDVPALVEMLRSKGLLSSEELELLMQQPSRTSGREDSGSGGKSLPAWVERLTWGGDLRLRYQADLFDNRNVTGLAVPSDPTVALNTTEERHRFRYRARLSLKARVNDGLEAGFRLATGSDKDPVSTNDTLGDTFNKDGILFDQAYLSWTPRPGLKATGGRLPNPWLSTDLVWDNDLNFEGLAVSHTQGLGAHWAVFGTGGAFPIQEVEQFGQDKWLYGAQLGVQARHLSGNLEWQLAGAYYHFDNLQGEVSAINTDVSLNTSPPQFQQKGNTLMDIDPLGGENNITGALAYDFQLVDVMAMCDIGFWDPVHLVLVGDYVKNIGADRAELERRLGTNLADTDTGYLAGAALGMPSVRQAGDWKGYLFYKYLQGDAVVDGFTDSDFHLGGTNAKGWILGGEVGLAKNTWLSLKWQTADEIDGPPLAIDVLQVDLNAKF